MNSEFSCKGIHDKIVQENLKKNLIIMLPGAKNTAQQFFDYDFVSELRRHILDIDVFAIDTHVDLYLEYSDVEQLLINILMEARSIGYINIWLLGISLGGTGVMLAATNNSVDIKGIFLIAPYLGSRGFIAEINRAGGLLNWKNNEININDHERILLDRIKNYLAQSEKLPYLYIGCGDKDRYIASSEIFLPLRPEHHLTIVSGGHDWEAWGNIWKTILANNPF